MILRLRIERGAPAARERCEHAEQLSGMFSRGRQGNSIPMQYGLSGVRGDRDGVLAEEIHPDERFPFALTAQSLVLRVVPATDRPHSGFRQFGVATHDSHVFDRAVGANQCFQVQLSHQIRVRHNRFHQVTLGKTRDEEWLRRGR